MFPISIPAPGIRSLNDIPGTGGPISIVSTDTSVTITPNDVTREIDLSVSAVAAANNNIITDLDCDASTFVGAWVRILDGVIVNAIASGVVANSELIGLIESKPSATKCNVLTSGRSSVVFSGLTSASHYYLSDTISGGMSIAGNVQSGNYITPLGVALTDTAFIVNISQRTKRS